MSLFCPKCGSILLPKRSQNDEVKMMCSCGYMKKADDASKITETMSKSKKIDVVTQKEELLPTTDAECSKCGNATAYYWLIQTRAGDEPETKFLRCTKCDHTWRDYS